MSVHNVLVLFFLFYQLLVCKYSKVSVANTPVLVNPGKVNYAAGAAVWLQRTISEILSRYFFTSVSHVNNCLRGCQTIDKIGREKSDDKIGEP